VSRHSSGIPGEQKGHGGVHDMAPTSQEQATNLGKLASLICFLPVLAPRVAIMARVPTVLHAGALHLQHKRHLT